MERYTVLNTLIGVIVLVAGILLMGDIAHATIIIPVTLEYMTEESDTIVVGRVTGQQSYWEDGNIYTDVMIQVQEFVKKADEHTPTEITLKLLGGTVGDMRQVVDGNADFQPDDKVMLFLNAIPGTGQYTTFGLEYGVYKIRWDSKSQQEFLHGPFFEYTEHVDLKTKKHVPISVELSKDEAKELRAFLTIIKRLVK